ncbi:TSUP family transporter [Pseudoroseomonas cervicalis]|uniref:TSUP family transporter n=1 Tax=Teichococcus cervicalis TaxID=204525 RepID=UPI002787BB40|nr:TSUP family transporter [Pseudoroseomonas cervicalis]MDQ1080544.1 putative membrane protein YfcA [Pseudoroseomonas cervicalis]
MPDWLYLGGVFLLAGLVKGVLGLGLPTVAMGLLGAVLPPAQAAGLLLLPSLVTNLWQLLAGPGWVGLLRRLGWMMLAILLGTAAGAGLLAGGDAALARRLLGAALLAYAALGLRRLPWRVSPRAERWLGPVVGGVTGVVTGATGVFVIPAVPYLAALGLPRDLLVQALGLSFTVSTLALGLGLAWHGALPGLLLGQSLLALAPALAGMALGGWLRQRIPPERFRIVFFLGLAVLGAELLLR